MAGTTTRLPNVGRADEECGIGHLNIVKRVRMASPHAGHVRRMKFRAAIVKLVQGSEAFSWMPWPSLHSQGDHDCGTQEVASVYSG